MHLVVQGGHSSQDHHTGQGKHVQHGKVFDPSPGLPQADRCIAQHFNNKEQGVQKRQEDQQYGQSNGSTWKSRPERPYQGHQR
eukprot:Skav217697  [mRNA]  locus=scaffold1925:177165:189481:+ [translate_table: standard]